MIDVSLQISVSERVEKEARKAGLLSGAFVRDAIERELERRSAARRLVRNVGKFRTLGLPPVRASEVKSEVVAVRKGRRAARANRH